MPEKIGPIIIGIATGVFSIPKIDEYLFNPNNSVVTVGPKTPIAPIPKPIRDAPAHNKK